MDHQNAVVALEKRAAALQEALLKIESTDTGMPSPRPGGKQMGQA